jgi:hypothetical protein
MSGTNQKLATFLFITLNIIMISCEELKTSKLSINNMIVEIRSEASFFSEVKNCIKSFDEGVFIHYDYSDDDEEEKEETQENDVTEEIDEILNREFGEEKIVDETYSTEQDLEELEAIEKKLKNMKDDEINEEELRITLIKVNKIMNRYNKNENSIEKTDMEMDSQHYDDDEYIDEEDQNSMIKFYVNEKLAETTNIENNSFDDYLKQSVKKLNLLKLFTMETTVEMKLAAVL